MRCPVLIAWLYSFSLLFALAASPVLADEDSGRRAASFLDSLPRAADAAPTPQDALESARRRLRSSIQPLREFLATGGSQKEILWTQWLELPVLEAQLTAAQPDVALLNEHLGRLHLDHSGLELPPFVAVREELRRFLAASEFSAAESPDDLFHSRLYDLSDCLSRLDAAPTAQDSHDSGRLVAWFDSLGGDSTQIAAAVRLSYCRTNAVGQLSSRLVNLMLQRDVQCQHLIAETMLGSFTRGVAFTSARVSTRFVPSREHATLEL